MSKMTHSTQNGSPDPGVISQELPHFLGMSVDPQAFLISQILPAIAKRIDLLALSSLSLTEDEVSREILTYKTRPFLQEFSDFVLSHQIKPDKEGNLPSLLASWIDAAPVHAKLYKQLEQEHHLLEQFQNAVHTFENLFAPEYGVIPTTAGIIRCLGQEINAIKLRFVSKVGLLSNTDLARQMVRLYVDALRHYPYLGHVDPSMRSFRLTSEQGLRDAFFITHYAMLVIADLLAGLPLIVTVNGLAKRITDFNSAHIRLVAEVVDYKATDGDDFQVLTIKVLRGA
jgi:hypothetical protein